MTKRTPPPATAPRDRAAIEHDLSTLGARRAELTTELADVNASIKDIVLTEVAPRLIPARQQADADHDWMLKHVAQLTGVGRQAVDAWLGKHSYADARLHDRTTLRVKATGSDKPMRQGGLQPQPRAKTAASTKRSRAKSTTVAGGKRRAAK